MEISNGTNTVSSCYISTDPAWQSNYNGATLTYGMSSTIRPKMEVTLELKPRGDMSAKDFYKKVNKLQQAIAELNWEFVSVEALIHKS